MASRQQDPHRHKRTYDEISQAQSSRMSSISSFLRPLGSPSPVDNSPIFVERRRTSHPHNPQPRSNFFAPAREVMASQQQVQTQPSLIHQASQTVIDLTDDIEEVDQAAATENFMRGYPRPPPQLARSDGSRLGEIIDLTEDIDEEIEITLARPVPDRIAAPPHPPASIRDALLIDRREHHRHRHRNRHNNNNNHFEDDFDFGFFRQADDHHTGDILDRYRLSRLIDDGDLRDLHEFRPAIYARPPQAMPHVLDYAINAFHIQPPPPPPAAPQKPPHQVPAAAKNGFTRSPTEDDIIICPGCEEELVSKRGEDDQPVLKKGNRAPSRKEREEHPFWVVKECGHVYCNKCFQHRKPDKKTISVFPEVTKENSKSKGRVLICAVDACDSEVSSKDKWVGVFV